MNEMITFISVGVLGGVARAVYGLLKSLSAGFEVNYRYFLVTLTVSGIIGGMLGYVFNIDFKIAALAGYVGTDILENVFKGALPNTIILKRK